jgi:fatty-acid peroxygenase
MEAPLTPLPRERAFDSTLALLSNGYRFISNRCHRHRSDIFETRLMLQKAICTMGEEAARMFYQPDRFTRNMRWRSPG